MVMTIVVRDIVVSSVLVKYIFEKNLPGEFWWFPTVIVPVYLLGYPVRIWVGSGDDEMDRRVNLFLQRLHCCRFPCGSRLFGTAIHLHVPHMRPPVLLASTCFLVSKVFGRVYYNSL